MRYKIVTGSNKQELEDFVNIYINKGWRPLGAPIFQAGSYHQAMTLSAEEQGWS